MKSRVAFSMVTRSACLLLTNAIVTASAGATAPPSRMFVSYRAPPTCPDRATFIQLLLRRIAPASLTDEPEWGRPVLVNLEADGPEFVGQMEFDDGAGQPVMRTVRASRCEDVASAMALVTALAVEPLVAAPASQSDPRPLSGVVPQPSPPEQAKPQPPLAKATQISISGHVSVVSKPDRPTSKRTYTQEVNLTLGIVNGLVGSGIAMGPGIGWGIGHRPSLPVLRIAATWTDDRWTVFSNQRSDISHFRLVAGTAQFCAGKGLFASTTVTGAVCSGPELGQYFAEGTPSAATQAKGTKHGIFWASADLKLHLRVEDQGIFFDVSPSMRFPLVRHDFVAEHPAGDIHKIPVLAFGADLAIGAVFR